MKEALHQMADTVSTFDKRHGWSPFGRRNDRIYLEQRSAASGGCMPPGSEESRWQDSRSRSSMLQVDVSLGCQHREVPMRRSTLLISIVAIAAVALFAISRGGVTPWGAIISIVMFAVAIAAFQLMNRGPWI
jgi:hypothetical protein